MRRSLVHATGCPVGSELTTPLLSEANSVFEAELDGVVEALRAAGAVISRVSCNKPVESVFGCIAAAVDPFFPTTGNAFFWCSSNFTENGLVVRLEPDALTDDHSPHEHVLGDYNRFSPVALMRNNTLVPGSKEHAVVYRGYAYLLADAEEVDLFCENPPHYVSCKGPPSPPPPLIFIVGCTAAGKTEQAERLAAKYGLHILDIKSIVMAASRMNTELGYDKEVHGSF